MFAAYAKQSRKHTKTVERTNSVAIASSALYWYRIISCCFSVNAILGDDFSETI